MLEALLMFAMLVTPAAKEKPLQSPRPPQAGIPVVDDTKQEKNCLCSENCVCGCNEGNGCRCRQSYLQSQPAFQPRTGVPIYQGMPVQPFGSFAAPAFSPQSFAPSIGFSGGAGAACPT